MFENVTIIGTGLLGGSLAKELRARQLAKHIVGVCRSQETAEQALASGLVDQVLPLELAVSNADLIVLATPMQAMVPILCRVAPMIPQSAILTDVGSVKTDLYAQLKAQVPSLLDRFVLAHPIAGGENSGVAASSLGLFEHKHLIITRTNEVSEKATQMVSELWQIIGATVLSMSLEEHDAIFAKTSHLPHVIAFSLVNFLSRQPNRERLFELAAAGFYDFTRIASSDAEMWRDICITNRDQVLGALDGFRDQLDEIRKQVATGDQEVILEYFNEAKAARDVGLMKKDNTKTDKIKNV